MCSKKKKKEFPLKTGKIAAIPRYRVERLEERGCAAVFGRTYSAVQNPDGEQCLSIACELNCLTRDLKSPTPPERRKVLP